MDEAALRVGDEERRRERIVRRIRSPASTSEAHVARSHGVSAVHGEEGIALLAVRVTFRQSVGDWETRRTRSARQT
jgi:hypothetical protein